jgi:hypothetical protein
MSFPLVGNLSFLHNEPHKAERKILDKPASGGQAGMTELNQGCHFNFQLFMK